MRCIIAGGRDFTDYDLLVRSMEDFINEHGLPSFIISGCARGADTLGERFAKDVGIEVIRYPADWEKHGKRAGPLRNIEMANNAESLVAFHDKNSKGTAHMISEAQKRSLIVKVVNY